MHFGSTLCLHFRNNRNESRTRFRLVLFLLLLTYSSPSGNTQRQIMGYITQSAPQYMVIMYKTSVQSICCITVCIYSFRITKPINTQTPIYTFLCIHKTYVASNTDNETRHLKITRKQSTFGSSCQPANDLCPIAALVYLSFCQSAAHVLL